MMKEQKNNTLSLLLAFLAGVVIAAIVAFVWVRQQGIPSAAAPAATEAPPQAAQAEDSEKKPVDYAAVFPSWNPDSTSLRELVDFVGSGTDPSGTD